VTETGKDYVATEAVPVNVGSRVRSVTGKVGIRSRYGRGREDKDGVDETEKDNELRLGHISLVRW
jgi:hypothetical protein